VEEDLVDRFVADVKRLRPDIDPRLKAVSARLLHLSDLVQRYYSGISERFDVSLSGLAVMTALARAAPRELTLTEINRDIIVTSGGITFVVSQLEKQGLLTRRPHPNDGRAVLIRLTSRGGRLADRLIEAVATADAAAFAHLGEADRRTTERLLRRVQTGIESAMTSDQSMQRASERHH
jgi:DNA-binding MarR family transcriptional regulator